MDSSTEHWLADLIETHLDDLTNMLAEAGQREMAMYAALPFPTVAAAMQVFCRKLAETTRASDVEIMRAYLEPAAMARLKSGFPVQGYLRLADVFESHLDGLIEQEAPDNPARCTAATRHLRAMMNQVRMLFSKINMRVLTEPEPPT